MENKINLSDSALDHVSGGAAAPGSVVKCKATSPLFSTNPAGFNNRSSSNTLCTVEPNADVKLYEFGQQFCKVIYQGKIGWIETANLIIR